MGLMAALVFVRWPQRREETAIARAAKNTTPEVAELLREINDVACTVVERYPDRPEAVDVMARLHYRFTELEAAIEYWQQAIELDPDFCPAYHSIGSHYLEIGDNAKAIKYFRKALELEPGSPAFAVELAQALIGDGQVEEGIRILLEDLKIHPKAMGTLAMLGHAYIQTRDYAEAKKYFELAIEVGPNYANAYHGLVTACANLGEEDLAKEYAEKLKEMKDRDDATHRQELKTFDDVVNVKRTMAEIYTTAANVYLAQNEPQIAEEHLQRAIELNPASVPAHEVLTWLYQRQGRKQEAAQALQALAKVAPDNVAGHTSYAALCLELGWLDEAEEAYRKTIDLTPRQAGGYVALARFYVEHARNLPEAKRLAQKAVDLEPTAEHYYWLAAACQINGDREGAREAMEQAVLRDPANPEYRKVLKLLGSRV
jgi:tetratricopeptide (TPR) repeat protein